MKPLSRFAALLFAALPVVASAAFEQCRDQFPAASVPAIPVDGMQPRDLCFDGFAVLHSGTTRTPIYAAERLNRARLLQARSQQRADRFYEEARLPSRERARLADYLRSGYDRGHVAPAGDMPDGNAMAQCFSLANMVPQDGHHNRETWSRIEQDTRRYAMRARGDVYVFTGPWYDGEPRTIGGGRVRVPDVLWKLVYDATSGRSWVHWSRNDARAVVERPIAYDEFVRRTGLRLLPG
jgi:endonuclease G, mitochondrial